MIASSVRWTFWPSLAATVLILALGRPLLWLFGPSFVAGYPLMFILAVGLLARASIGPAERLLNMLGEQRVCMAVYATAFATNLGLCLLLAPRLGTVGAAIATALRARRRVDAALPRHPAPPGLSHLCVGTAGRALKLAQDLKS